MICYKKIHCPHCDSTQIKKSGKSATGTQRYKCCNPECMTNTFMLEYLYRAYEPAWYQGKDY